MVSRINKKESGFPMGWSRPPKEVVPGRRWGREATVNKEHKTNPFWGIFFGVVLQHFARLRAPTSGNAMV